MSLENPFTDYVFGDFLESLLPDFILAFAFFTALTYAILGKRLDHRRLERKANQGSAVLLGRRVRARRQERQHSVSGATNGSRGGRPLFWRFRPRQRPPDPCCVQPHQVPDGRRGIANFCRERNRIYSFR